MLQRIAQLGVWLLAAAAVMAGDGRVEISQSRIPFTITNSGSYLVTEHLQGFGGGTNGITIAASHVTLDLGGFTLEGVAGSGSGIHVSSPRTNLVIRNGFIRGWGQHGVNASVASNCLFESLRVANCAQDGLRAGLGSIVADCAFLGNGAAGLAATSAVVVVSTASRGNGQQGYLARDYAVFSEVSARENGQHGIEAGRCAAVLNAAVRDNQLDGIRLGVAGLVSESAAYGNKSNGVSLTGQGGKVQRTSAFGNTGHGVWTDTDSMVEDVVARANTNGGIRVTNNCYVLNSHVDQSVAGAGVSVQGIATRVEQVHAGRSLFGLAVSGTNNFIAGNSARGNATLNYGFSSTNNYYEIEVNPGSVATNFDEPWASYDLP